MSTGATAPATDPGTITQPPLAAMAAAAQRIRRDIVEMTTAAGSGHPSSSLSAVEIMTALYFGGLLRHDAARPEWPERDRFILSKGHAAPILYAVLAERGYFGVDPAIEPAAPRQPARRTSQHAPPARRRGLHRLVGPGVVHWAGPRAGRPG